MYNNPFFNFNRLYNLIRRENTIRRKSYLTGIAAIVGLFVLTIVANSYGSRQVVYDGALEIFYFLVFLGGMIFTSRIFSEMNEPQKGYRYLTLPASTLEKLAAQWLLSSFGYLLAVSALFFVSVLLGGLLSSALFDVGFSWLELSAFEMSAGELIGSYLVAHSIFFLGACAFQKHNFLKTILSVVIVSIVIGLIVVGVAYLMLGDQVMTQGEVHFSSAEFALQDQFTQIAEVVIDYLTVPFFLVVSYFKLKERQV